MKNITKLLFMTALCGMIFISCKEKTPELKNTKWVDEKAVNTLEFTSDTECVFFSEGGQLLGEIYVNTIDTAYIDEYDEYDNYVGQKAIVIKNHLDTTYIDHFDDYDNFIEQKIIISAPDINQYITYTYNYKYPNISFSLEEHEPRNFKEITGLINEDIITIREGDRIILTLAKEKK